MAGLYFATFVVLVGRGLGNCWRRACRAAFVPGHCSRSSAQHLLQHCTVVHGTCKGYRDAGPKEISRVCVPKGPKGENIVLFLEGTLWERGCTTDRGHKHEIITPKGISVEIKMRGTLPYTSKQELQSKMRFQNMMFQGEVVT